MDRKADKRGEGWGRGGETQGSDVPSRRISPLTLLSYKWGYHLRWSHRPGGEVERFFFPPPLPKPIGAGAPNMGKPLGCIGEHYTRWCVAWQT